MKRITNQHVLRKNSAKLLKRVFKSENSLVMQLSCTLLGV